MSGQPRRPRVSVIVPTYNRAATLERCLASLASQTQAPDEVVVADDGSTDGTPALVRARFPAVRYVRQERNRGPAAARNLGLARAGGDIVLFTDDDCVAPSDWVARHLPYYDDPRIGAVGGLQVVEAPNFYERFDVASRADEWRGARRIERLVGRESLYTNNLSVRREALDRAGPFDERFRRGAERDLMQRLTGAGYVLVWDPALRLRHLKEYSLRSYLRTWYLRGQGSMLADLKDGTLCGRRFVPLPNAVRLWGVWRSYRALFGGTWMTGAGFWALAAIARWMEVAGRVRCYWTMRGAFDGRVDR